MSAHARCPVGDEVGGLPLVEPELGELVFEAGDGIVAGDDESGVGFRQRHRRIPEEGGIRAPGGIRECSIPRRDHRPRGAGASVGGGDALGRRVHGVEGSLQVQRHRHRPLLLRIQVEHRLVCLLRALFHHVDDNEDHRDRNTQGHNGGQYLQHSLHGIPLLSMHPSLGPRLPPPVILTS